MKKSIFLAISVAFIGATTLSVGYYKTSWAEDNEIVFFIKKSSTFQIKFVNYFSTDSEDKSKIHKLENSDRRLIINYCKYHLGIEIEMKTQEEMDTCANAYYATRKKPASDEIGADQ